MAYNILKGNVEFTGDNGSLENTVDQTTAQSIGGVKTFTSAITSSVALYDGAGNQITAPVVNSVTNASATRVSFFNGASGLEGSANLTFNGTTLTGAFTGSGAGLTALRGDRFTTTISASSIKFGDGLRSDSGVLAVSGGAGIVVNAGGIKPSLDTYGGLNFNATTLMLDATTTYDISNNGQSLATGDKLFVQDVAGANPSAPALRSMTVGTLATYLQSNLTFSPITTYSSAGQYKIVVGAATSNTVNGSALTFDGSDLSGSGYRIIAMDYTGSGEIKTNKLTASAGAYITGNVGINTNDPSYDLHVNGAGGTTVFVDGGGSSDAFVRFGTAGVAKSYVKLGSGGNFIMAQDATGGDLELKAKPGGVSTTYFALDGGRTALTASVPLSCSLSVSASYFYGDGRHLTNVAGGGGLISTYTNATDNYVLTSAGSGSINGESNLTFDGTTLVAPEVSSSLSVSASYFYGDGRHLTNVAGGGGLISTYTNATDNYVLTSAGSGSINGESGLTFDGAGLTIRHNPTSLANDAGTGEIVLFGGGTTVKGKTYYLHSSGDWEETSIMIAASGGLGMIGVALGTSPASDGMLIRGFFDAHTYLSGGFAIGTTLYLTASGGITTDRPSGSGESLRVIGTCTTTANVIYFNPSPDYLVIV